jgi:hypothetical protein
VEEDLAAGRKERFRGGRADLSERYYYVAGPPGAPSNAALQH